jgi:hypothetical protein
MAQDLLDIMNCFSKSLLKPGRQSRDFRPLKESEVLRNPQEWGAPLQAWRNQGMPHGGLRGDSGRRKMAEVWRDAC